MQDARKTVLLVEDEAIIALAETNQLRQAGYDVIQALTGEGAIEIARAESARIDLILMDIDLGKGIDGTEAARRILAVRELPILFLSGHMEPAIVSRTEEIAGYGYVVKNAPFTVIDASIKMALKLFAAKRQLHLNGLELEAANARLAFSEEKYEKLFQTNPDYITISDLHDGTFLEVNEGFCRMTGYEREEVIGRSALDPSIDLWVYPAERQGLVELLRDGQEVMNYKATMRRKSGEHFIADTCSRVIEIGGKQAFIGVVKDITQEEKLLEELHGSEERFNLVMEVTNDGIWDYDFVSRRIYASPSYRRMFGFDMDEEIAPARLREFVHPDDRESAVAALRDCIEGRTPYFDIEFRIIAKDGALKWTRTRAKVVKRNEAGEATRIIGTCIDITEKKEIEGRKDFEHSLNDALMDNIPDTIYFKDLEGRFVRVNKAHAAKMGFSKPEAAIGKTDFDIFARESALLSKRDDDAVLSSGKPLVIPDEKRTWADGTTNHFSVIKMPRFDEEGRLVGLFGISRDITAEKEKEEALRRSQQRYYELLNSIGEGFIELDANEVFLEANRAAERIFGVKPGKLVGRSLFEFLDEEGRRIADEQVSTNRIDLKTTEYVSPIITQGGQRRWVQVSAQPISKTPKTYRGSISVVRDITDEVKGKEELTALIERKELLVKELQHRVKNTLNLVSSILQLSKSEIADERAASTIEDAQARIGSMSRIYEQLYLTGSVDSLDFGQYIRRLSREIFETYSSLVPKVELSVDASPLQIDTKRAISLGLIVNELLTNAIKYAFRPGQAGKIGVAFSRDSRRASLVVSDDGIGLGGAEPIESSTSLGFSLVRVLVEQIGGTLAVESSGGTRISVSFGL